MDEKWKGSGYDPDKAWEQIQKEDLQRTVGPGELRARDYTLVIVLAVLAAITLIAGGLFFLQ